MGGGMKIRDHVEEFHDEGWCVVVSNCKWPTFRPLAAFSSPEAARCWIEKHGEEHGAYALHPVPLHNDEDT